jgi:dodecin
MRNFCNPPNPPSFAGHRGVRGMGSIDMAVVKVIELLGESGESWEDATRQVVAEAVKTLHGITSVYIKDFQATVENDKIKTFRVNTKVSFLLETR